MSANIETFFAACALTITIAVIAAILFFFACVAHWVHQDFVKERKERRAMRMHVQRTYGGLPE